VVLYFIKKLKGGFFMKLIDLRSDTVTLPTDKMRDAMRDAIVGDAVYGDDETTNKLEALAAQMTGMEAAMLVPSGTFGNQVAVLTHTRHGDEIILGASSHIKWHEVGGIALISGVLAHTIAEDDNGMMPISEIKMGIRTKDIHHPDTTLICLENAHGNGSVLPLDYMARVHQLAKDNNIPIHLDGARLFNAAAHLNVPASEICQYVDSVQFCLSKGLCAPIGSIVAGSEEFIDRARRNRKMLGGGMRQTGVIAAPGLIALEEMTKRLDVDHQNAEYFRTELNKLDGFKVVGGEDINLVFHSVEETIDYNMLVTELKKKNIVINGDEYGMCRFATHNGITKEDIDIVIKTIKDLI
jgi:threonine aldolase